MGAPDCATPARSGAAGQLVSTYGGDTLRFGSRDRVGDIAERVPCENRSAHLSRSCMSLSRADYYAEVSRTTCLSRPPTGAVVVRLRYPALLNEAGKILEAPRALSSTGHQARTPCGKERPRTRASRLRAQRTIPPTQARVREGRPSERGCRDHLLGRLGRDQS